MVDSLIIPSFILYRFAKVYFFVVALMSIADESLYFYQVFLFVSLLSVIASALFCSYFVTRSLFDEVYLIKSMVAPVVMFMISLPVLFIYDYRVAAFAFLFFSINETTIISASYISFKVKFFYFLLLSANLFYCYSSWSFSYFLLSEAIIRGLGVLIVTRVIYNKVMDFNNLYVVISGYVKEFSRILIDYGWVYFFNAIIGLSKFRVLELLLVIPKGAEAGLVVRLFEFIYSNISIIVNRLFAINYPHRKDRIKLLLGLLMLSSWVGLILLAQFVSFFDVNIFGVDELITLPLLIVLAIISGVFFLNLSNYKRNTIKKRFSASIKIHILEVILVSLLVAVLV